MWPHSQCLQEKKCSWEQYNVFLKDKFDMGTEWIGKTKDNKTKISPDLSSKAVDETQTGLGTLSVDSLSAAKEDTRSNGLRYLS